MRSRLLGPSERDAWRRRGAGFHEVGVSTISRTIRFADGTVFLRMNAMALVGMSATGKTMDDQGRQSMTETIVRESPPVLSAYSDGSGLAFALSTNLATAKG